KQFNSYTLDFDIMLIKLADPAVLNELVQPIGLPSQCTTAETQCLASEWSSSNSDGTGGLLQCTDLPTTSDAMCSNAYPGQFTDRMLCAGQLGSSQDTCKGDVGSPLVCEGALQGLLSWNNSCHEENRLGLYTKVCIFGDWIDYTIANN
ncbi:anionic trypsin-like, partial [Rhineura floridana]|uniref:anionic trypsin-like n=1 Tax=Rhineura floridana TaxID=261503 RepID=UPI002AC81BFD